MSWDAKVCDAPGKKVFPRTNRWQGLSYACHRYHSPLRASRRRFIFGSYAQLQKAVDFSVASLAFRLCRICSVSSYVKLPRIVVGDSLFVTEAGYRALKTERDRVTCLAPKLDYSGKRVFDLLPHIPRFTVFRWTAQLCDGKELKPRRRSHWVMRPLFARGGRVWGAP